MNEIIEQDCRRVLRHIPRQELAGRKVLVTGANGFLGQSVISALALANKVYRSKASITGVSLHGPSPLLDSLVKDKSIRFLIRDLSGEFSISGKYDYIFHTAGYGQPARFMQDPFGTVSVNVAATRTLLDMARQSKGNFVYFSSSEVYGDIPQENIPVEETYQGNCSTLLPRSIYSESKRLGEALCAEWARRFNVAAKIVRISHVYGPGLPETDTRVMSDFIRKAILERRIVLLDDGHAVKTYGYIADVTAMILWVAFSSAELVYNVGGRDSISIGDLARKIGKLCNSPVEMPDRTTSLADIGRDLPVVKLNLSRVLENMGKFRFTPFRQGLQRTIAWSNLIYRAETLIRRK
jgi:dTDP-glucose 4,6-dehydratase/UDP-glucuronate decarboxylase